MTETIVKDRGKIRRTGCIIRGHHNKIVGHNNIVYGDNNLGVGNNNRIYGNNNRWKGDFNILQGDDNRVKGKRNKIGAAAVMENRKRKREEDEANRNNNDDDDDEANSGSDDSDDSDVRHQVVDPRANAEIALHQILEATYRNNDNNNTTTTTNVFGVPLDYTQALRLLGEGFDLDGSASKCMRVPDGKWEKKDREANEDAGEPVCLACLVNVRCTTNVAADDERNPCGHHSYCVTCARLAYSGKRVGSKDARCPECRAKLSQVILSFVN